MAETLQSLLKRAGLSDHLASFEAEELTTELLAAMSPSNLRDEVCSELGLDADECTALLGALAGVTDSNQASDGNDKGSVGEDQPDDTEREGSKPTYFSSNNFFKGERVIIEGLQSKPHLNGKYGTVEKHMAAKGRYAVKLDSGGTPVLLKPENLSLEEDETGYSESDNILRPPGGKVIDARIHGPYGYLVEEKKKQENIVPLNPEEEFGLEESLDAEPERAEPILSEPGPSATEKPHEALVPLGTETARTALERGGSTERIFAKYEVLYGPVRVHEEPSLDSDVLDFKKKGDVLDTDMLQDGWVRLSGTDYFGGKRGWLIISGDQLGLGPLLEELSPPEFLDARLASPSRRPDEPEAEAEE